MPYLILKKDTLGLRTRRKSCVSEECPKCLLKYRDFDMAWPMLEMVDHSAILGSYDEIYRDDGVFKKISLRMELETYAKIVSFHRWVAMIAVLQSAIISLLGRHYSVYYPRGVRVSLIYICS